jgi:hypothetical protein
MNRILDDVRAAFDRVAVHPRSIAIDRKAVVLPAGGHFQGIQRIGDSQRLAVTSSSDSQAYFVVCEMTPDWTKGRANAPITLAARPLKHAGGCQTISSILAAGVEDDDGRRSSQVQFWNLAASPAQMTGLTIIRNGAQNVSTAGAVGLSSYGSGVALAVATWNADTIDFYVAAKDPFQGSGERFQFRRTWSRNTADKSGWIDKNFGAYQCVNLVTERDGALYLIGFNRSGGDDWMDLFQVNLDAPPPAMLKKVAKKHMYCSDGCSFEFGAGIHVSSPTQFDVFAVRGDSGDHATGTTIRANLFGVA